MSIRDLLLLLSMSFAWGMHFVVVKSIVGSIAEPLFYVATRMTLVALILLPLLKIHKGQMVRLLIAGACYGGFNYAFMFTGVHFSNASIAAVVIEAHAPMVMILSVIFLKEKVGWRRVMGLFLAMFGILVIMSANGIEDVGERVTLGIIFILCAAFCEAIGALHVKQIVGVTPFQMLGWFALIGSVILWTCTLVFEENQLEAFNTENRWPFIGGLIYTVFVASLFGHTVYYYLIQRTPLSQMSAVTLLTTIIAVIAGVVLLKEPVTKELVFGGFLTLLGVGIILMRNNQSGSHPKGPIVEHKEPL